MFFTILVIGSGDREVFAQTVSWRVSAASANSGIRPQGFPVDVIGVAVPQISAAGSLSLELSTASQPRTLWTQIADGGVRPVARYASTGALGPGRSGVQSDDVFSLVWSQDYSAASPFQLFAAVAGPVGQSNTTLGLWLNDGSRNTELARAGTDGPLGPNLGPSITLVGTTGSGNLALGRIQVLPGDSFALDADVQASERREVILRRAYAGSFSPCALEGSADPTLAPGVSSPDPDQFVGLSGLAQGAGGELYTFGSARLFVLSPTRVGIWRVCAGSPSARALTGNRAALGPGISGSPLAEFLFFSGELSPLGGGALLFTARARLDGSNSTSPLIDALFLNANGSNRPLLVLGASGALGPGIANFSFSGVDSFQGEGFAALLAEVRENGSIDNRRGLWRLETGRSPAPLALAGDTGALAPAPGDTWLSFDDARALANGDIVAVATSRPNGVNTRALWRFRQGRAPQRLLGPGDTVSYRDTAGVSRTGAVDRIDQLVGSQLPAYAGDEGWINAEGQVLLLGRLQGNAATLVFQSGAALLDRDALFNDGFEN